MENPVAITPKVLQEPMVKQLEKLDIILEKANTMDYPTPEAKIVFLDNKNKELKKENERYLFALKFCLVTLEPFSRFKRNVNPMDFRNPIKSCLNVIKALEKVNEK